MVSSLIQVNSRETVRHWESEIREISRNSQRRGLLVNQGVYNTPSADRLLCMSSAEEMLAAAFPVTALSKASSAGRDPAKQMGFSGPPLATWCSLVWWR